MRRRRCTHRLILTLLALVACSPRAVPSTRSPSQEDHHGRPTTSDFDARGRVRLDGPRGCGLIAINAYDDDTGEGGIWTVRPDATSKTLLFEDPNVFEAQWSPDARHVGFVLGGKSGRQWLHVMEPDGTRETRIARVPDNPWWDWAPGGRRIAVASNSWGLLRPIYVIGLDGSRRWMTLGKAPAWSPDGSEIAYSAGRIGRGGGGLFAVDVRRKTVRQLTFPVDASDTYPVWSPDGTTILFIRLPADQEGEDGPYGDLWSLDLETMATAQITRRQNDLNGVWGPKWSPHNDFILFEYEADGFGEAIISQPDGGHEWTVPTRDRYSRYADWFPDGKSVVFETLEGVRVIHAHGKRSRLLLHDGHRYWSRPDWAPC